MQFDSCACLDASAGLDHISCGPWRACGRSQAWEIPFCSGGHGTNLSLVLQLVPRRAGNRDARGEAPGTGAGWSCCASSVSLCAGTATLGFRGASGKASPECALWLGQLLVKPSSWVSQI